MKLSLVQSLRRLGRPGEVCVCVCGEGGHKGRLSRGPLPVFSAGGLCEQFWHGRGRPVFDGVHPACPLPTTTSRILYDNKDEVTT